MDEHLKLHKNLSQAEVEYQQKLDAVKDFEHGVLPGFPGSSVEQMLETWDRLMAEEKAAYDKREVARKAFRDYLNLTV